MNRYKALIVGINAITDLLLFPAVIVFLYNTTSFDTPAKWAIWVIFLCVWCKE